MSEFLLSREEIAQAFGSPRAIRRFEELQRSVVDTADTVTAGVASTAALRDATFVTLSANDELPNERVLAVGPGLSIQTAGAQATLRLTNAVPRATGGFSVQFTASGDSLVGLPLAGFLATRDDIIDAIASSGTVDSVNVSGGTTGLTTSGGPITTTGTITLAGTLAIANGGTGAATAADARTALGLGTAAVLSTADIDERARDALGAALVAGANITITVNDPADTITIAASGGGGGYTYATSAASFTETATSGEKITTITASGQTVTLPTAVGNTAKLTYKLMVAGTLTIDGNAAETIDGALTATLTTQYEAITLISTNANWVVI